eukprot:jgi/Chrzof1/6361/Cz18g05200.t1
MAEEWPQRLALVVGIQEYDSKFVNPLKTPAADARELESLLVNNGDFHSVSCVINPTRAQLLDALDNFKAHVSNLKSRGGCVALFYYSGHGLLDAAGHHYMLPIDWCVGRGGVEAALKNYGCKLESDALPSMQDAHAAIALIDACRSMP